MPVPKQQLRRFPFFRSLPQAELAWLARVVARRAFPAHTLIFREGDPGSEFYMILSGQVEVISGIGSSASRLNLLDAGDWFGELALIDNQPRSASALALTHTVLLALGKEDFHRLVTASPLALYTIAATTQQRLRERDRAYRAEMQLRVEQLEQLHETALDITRHLDRERALDAICERAVELLRSAGGDLYLYDPARKVLVPQGGTRPEPVKRRPGARCTAQAFATGQAQIERSHPGALTFGLAAPILLDARTLGVLTVYRASDGAPYEEADKTLAELFASQAAIVLENAQLYAMRVEKARLDGELDAAREVQRSLIPPQPPEIAGYQLAAMWQPARQVSGDFYDFIPMLENRVGMAIADVSDKGMPAALFMASARSVLRANAQLGGSAVEIVTRTNRAMVKDAPGGMFVTLFFGILDPLTHEFSYVNAGHNPPLFRRGRSRALVALRGENLALGILPDVPFSNGAVRLMRGDTIVLYTDGVTDATNPAGAFFDQSRLERLVRTAPPGSARGLIRRLSSQVRKFTGAHPQSDDITMVALRRN
jgi:serine phosphatase RsbU (regulator of sigma subunit)